MPIKPTLLPVQAAGVIAKVITKCTITSEIIYHIIISKYTLECTQLNYFFKNPQKSIPSNHLATKLITRDNMTVRQRKRDVLQYRQYTINYNYKLQHYLKNYAPICLNMNFYLSLPVIHAPPPLPSPSPITISIDM